MTNPAAVLADLFRDNVPYAETPTQRMADMFNSLLEQGTQWQDLTADYTLTSTTASQLLFNGTTAGSLALGTGVYSFEMLLYLTGMSATSGNAAIDILGAGTATMDHISQYTTGIDSDTPLSAAAQTGSASVTKASTASLVAAGTGSGLISMTRGMFRISAAGTIIPSIALVTSATPAVKAGSYFITKKLGETGETYRGTWA